MSSDEEFKNELRVLLTTNNNAENESSLCKKGKKRVSWLTNQDKSDKRNKKSIRSTPYPSKVKNLNQDSLTATHLSFDESDSELNAYKDNNIRKTKIKKRCISQIKKKIKRPKMEIKSSCKSGNNLPSTWLETNISSPVSSAESRVPNVSLENGFVCDSFDRKEQLVKKKLHKIKNTNIYLSEDETLRPHVEADQIELLQDSFKPVKNISFSDIEYETNNSCNDTFEIPKVLKNATKFEKQCEINEPEYMTKLLTLTTKTVVKKIKNNSSRSQEQNNSKQKIYYNKQINDTSTLNDSLNNIDDSISESDNESDEEYLENNSEFLNIAPAANQNANQSIQFYLSKNYCIFVLNHPSKLYFCGKLSVSVLSGALKIFGHTLEDSTKDFEVYSPKHSDYLCFETIERKKNENLKNIFKHYEINEKIINFVNTDNFTIVALKNIENKMVNCLEKHIPQNFFPKITQTNNDRFFSLAEMHLQCYFETQASYLPISIINEEWDSIINTILNRPTTMKSCLMVCGGKGVGKSTFLKYTLNKLLNDKKKVVYIDLDPGQPEFTISGCISVHIIDKPLFGPNYTHLRKPLRCHFIGEVNIRHCFNNYLNAVKDLMAYCNDNIDKSVPWIVNYIGFTKTLGIDLAVSVIKHISPTILVQIQSKNYTLNFPVILTKDYVMKNAKSEPNALNTDKLDYKLEVIASVAYNQSGKDRIAPRLLRNMSIVSYFSQMLNLGDEEISTVAPFFASLTSIKLSHINDSTENLPAILNGNLVALCADSKANCLGFGIVRGVDMNSNKLYLISPEDTNIMQRIDNVVMGIITLPVSFYLAAGKHDGTIPYVCLTKAQTTTIIPKRSYRACRNLIARK